MTRKTLTIFLVILIQIGCTEKSSNDSKDKSVDTLHSKPIDFNDFLDNIPTTKLPLTIKCGFEETINETGFKNKYNQFIPKDFEVVGKLKTDKDFNLVLFASIGDILYPYLFSLDKDGDKIDSLYLHVSTCAGDPNLELSTWSIIEHDLIINMTDTTKYFNYIESDNDYTRKLDSTIITKRSVQMDNSGRFTIKQEEKEKITVANQVDGSAPVS